MQAENQLSDDGSKRFWTVIATNIGDPNIYKGAFAVIVAVAIYIFANGNEIRMGTYWLLGLGAGFVLQRTRLCFASGFRDIFLLGHGRNLKGILVGLMVASVGFSFLLARQVPNTALGTFPATAHIMPLGWHTIFGATLFGFGMVLAGGCVTGSIYRMGEGYVGSWVSFAGILLGLFIASFTWNWWYEFTIQDSPRLWLPHAFGHGGALFITLGALIFLYILVIWWETRRGGIAPAQPAQLLPDTTFSNKIQNMTRQIFVNGWHVLLGGGIFGLVNILTFVSTRPLGVTGELSRWSLSLGNAMGLTPGELLGTNSMAGCVLDTGDGTVLTFLLFLVVGIFYGSFIGALFSGEFKIRIPKQKSRLVQSGVGGVLMGYGAGTAVGCTIGAFFSAIPSFSVTGWVWALCALAGAWIGTQVIQRLP
jgi:uncharacterized membrane protein YedE/YeeE